MFVGQVISVFFLSHYCTSMFSVFFYEESDSRKKKTNAVELSSIFNTKATLRSQKLAGTPHTESLLLLFVVYF